MDGDTARDTVRVGSARLGELEPTGEVDKAIASGRDDYLSEARPMDPESVLGQLDRQRVIVHDLAVAIGVLEGRLGPVLTPMSAEIMHGAARASDDGTRHSGIAEEVEHVDSDLIQIVDRVRTLTSRVDL